MRKNKRKIHSYMNSKMHGCELFWPLDKCCQIGNIFHVPDQKTQLHAALHFSYILKAMVCFSEKLSFYIFCMMQWIAMFMSDSINLRRKEDSAPSRNGVIFFCLLSFSIYQHENICNSVSGVKHFDHRLSSLKRKTKKLMQIKK